MGIDIVTTLYAIVAFIIIGVGLAALILFTRAKLVKSEACKIFINNDDSLTKEAPRRIHLAAGFELQWDPGPLAVRRKGDLPPMRGADHRGGKRSSGDRSGCLLEKTA